MDPKDTVRRGYDALSYRYRGDTGAPEHYGTWLAQLQERVPAGGAILDLGCGCGVPLARDLAASGYEIIGVDVSAVQVSVVPEGDGVHALFWARRPLDRPQWWKDRTRTLPRPGGRLANEASGHHGRVSPSS